MGMDHILDVNKVGEFYVGAAGSCTCSNPDERLIVVNNASLIVNNVSLVVKDISLVVKWKAHVAVVRTTYRWQRGWRGRLRGGWRWRQGGLSFISAAGRLLPRPPPRQQAPG